MGFRQAAKATGKMLAWSLAALIAAAALAAGAAYFREHRRFDLPYPAVRSTGDSAAIARGRYLVHGPGHCADCHASPAHKERADRGEEVPLSGGRYLDIFLGRMHFPNITPDSATGIGSRTDGELARLFRRGIDHRGEIGLPFMQYERISDGDLAAILSYLRSIPAVAHEVPRSRYNLLGKITRAYFLEPFGSDAPVPPAPPAGRTAEYGRYLVEAVADCASCHTQRNMKTGEYTGPRYGGGMVFRRAGHPEQIALSPNLTPDRETGVMVHWDMEAFIRRFRAGAAGPWSPMPWGALSRMTDDDLAAMYLYLSTLEPVRRPTTEAP